MTNQTSDSNSIINSVKRLERAGSEHSRATEKLCEAAIRTLNFLYDTVPSDFYFADPREKGFPRPERDLERKRLESLGIEAGTCEGCYQNPCACLPDDSPRDPE